MNYFSQFLHRILRRTPDQMPNAEALAFITMAYDEMLTQHREHAATWPHGKERGWTADLSAGVIMFKFDGDRTGTAHFQTIGTYNETTASFTWAWANDSLPSALRKHAKLAKKWGATHRHSSFLNKTVQCTMEDAWNFAAVTRKVANAKSVYRGRVGSEFIFMTTDEVHLDTEVPSTHWSAGRRRASW
ncbi:DUF6882 domain-containing protein [Undibacterium sp. Di24W]|uniref:DUF6882 domain-containing protein n=1 Tax=Undibacterium sp. Di24W TaxID=3413033 RepID=UPI003BF433F6